MRVMPSLSLETSGSDGKANVGTFRLSQTKPAPSPSSNFDHKRPALRKRDNCIQAGTNCIDYTRDLSEPSDKSTPPMKISRPLLILASLIFINQDLPADAPTAPAAPTPTPAAAPAGPAPVLFETAKLKGADVEIKEDAQALGGEYVMNHQGYNPVAFINTPAGDSFTVWGHVRGSSFQIKAVVNGAQKELDWVWGAPGPFVWKKFGTYPRASLGDSIVIIRGANADATDGIDAVLFSPDPNFAPDAQKNIETYLAH
jgi:hypothetical protein